MRTIRLLVFLLLLSSPILAAERYSLAPGSAVEPCNSEWYYREWVNTFPYTIYVKHLWIWNGASAGMVADIHTTVWKVSTGDEAMVVQIVPWDRYDHTPKPPAEEDLGVDHITLRPGDKLVWGAACTVLRVDPVNPPSHTSHHYQTKIAYNR